VFTAPVPECHDLTIACVGFESIISWGLTRQLLRTFTCNEPSVAASLGPKIGKIARRAIGAKAAKILPGGPASRTRHASIRGAKQGF
jgi:hypothetical protein